jgi:hypothetical protein
MRLIKSADLEIVRLALLHNVSDTRQCPCCGDAFIPNDATSKEAAAALILVPAIPAPLPQDTEGA